MVFAWVKALKRFLGIEVEQISFAEKFVSTLGGVVSLLGIYLVSKALVSNSLVGEPGALIIATSMGASTVLLFAVPHGRLSQPWSLIGGHCASALIGVTCYKWIPDPMFAAGIAVGLSIGAMHILGCIHPPGGATALAAILGGSEIQALGYGYVLIPVLLNVATIFFVAVAFNYFFPWRRYPTSLMRFTNIPVHQTTNSSSLIEKRFIEQAMQDMDTIVDFTTDDLQRLIGLTLQHADSATMSTKQILLGRYYTNGKHGVEWSVRQIIDESQSNNPKHDMVIYRVVEGQNKNSADSCTRAEFAHWAGWEVFPNRKN